jgi:hypothetical protein
MDVTIVNITGASAIHERKRNIASAIVNITSASAIALFTAIVNITSASAIAPLTGAHDTHEASKVDAAAVIDVA